MANGWDAAAKEIEARIVDRGIDGVTEKDLLVLLVSRQTVVLQPKYVYGTLIALATIIVGGQPVASKLVEIVPKLVGG